MNVEDVMSKREVLTLWQVPRNSIIGTFWWFYSWPIRFVLAMTLPNPRTRRRFYVATFLLCIVWIGVVAYLIFWMLVVIGKLGHYKTGTITTNGVGRNYSIFNNR